MRDLNEIIVHCTATRPDWWADKSTDEKAAEIRRWHVAPPPNGRGWSDIGYHFLIDRDGTVVSGRPLGKVGAHTKGHNTGTIGISLLGGFGGASSDAFDDHFTEDQDAALRKLISQLKQQYPTISKVSGHNQYAAKACPCFSVPNWIVGDGKAKLNPTVISRERTSATQSRTVQSSVVQGVTAAGGAVAAFQGLSGAAQVVALIGCFVIAGLALFILKERLKAWAAGWR